MTTAGSDFDIAKAIADQLKGVESERQQRIIRWVAESLGLDLQLARPVERSAATGTESSPGAPSLHRQRHAVDIKSFIESKQPKSDVQFAAAVAYYYRFEAPPEDRKDAITAEVLQDAARLANRRRPPQPLMTLNNAKNLGYLDSPERGQFRINSVGENLIAMTLPGGGGERATKRTTRGSAPKRRAKKA